MGWVDDDDGGRRVPNSDRWVEVSPSQFTHERRGLESVRAWLPDEPPYRAWTNFEFRDSHGHWHECDLLVLGRAGLYLVELKYYSGVISGDDRRWKRSGGRYEDSPLLLCRRKAQRLASKLKDAAREWLIESGQGDVDAKVRQIVPFIQEAVFLHHSGVEVLLPPSSALGLYGLEDAETTSHLPPLSELVEQLPSPHRPEVGPNQDAILAALMRRIGLVPRREREAGSWIIQEGVVDEGEGWQDWLCTHAADPSLQGRVRFSITADAAAEEDKQRAKRLAANEYKLARTLKHDSILTPLDMVQSELGTGLVYPYDESWQRLDLWLAEQGPVPLEMALSVVSQMGDAVRYAHSHEVAHRALGAAAVWLRGSGDDVQVQVRDWQFSGALEPTDTRHAVTQLAPSGLSRLAATVEPWMVEAFLAPETMWQATDRARLDVFSLGALAAYLVSGRPPAESAGALQARLRQQQGIDVAVDAPVPEGIRQVILAATRGVVSARTATVAEFLGALDAAVVALGQTDDSAVDPLEARPGAVLDGRFTVEKRLGVGSTARGLLVTDAEAQGTAKRVLKVALDAVAAERLDAEAEVLRGLKHRRFAGLVEGPLEVAGRQALLLESAGATTLADELRPGVPLPLDYVERWGGNLMEALVELDRVGIDHRDIKPANLGVRENPSDRKPELVLFDFSLTRARADAVDAGTPQYRDPFLGKGRRHAFDSHAERYSAAAVLYQMTTGSLPRFGLDGQTLPTVVDDEASVDPADFAPSLAREFTEFFTTALRRDARERYDTAAAMAAAWSAIFASGRTTVAPSEDDDALAEKATLETPLTQAGLTARALSALAAFKVETVRDFLTKVDAGHPYPRVAVATRRHLQERRRRWATALGDPRASRQARRGEGVEVAAQVLLDAAGPTTATVRRGLLTLVLGRRVGAHAFAQAGELGAQMPDRLPRGRVQQLLDDLQGAFAETEEASALLDLVGRVLVERVAEYGGVVTFGEATSAVLDAVQESTSGAEVRRVAEGLLRLTLERMKRLRSQAVEWLGEPMAVRRREGRVVMLGTNPALFDVADAVGTAAQELVTGTTGKDHALLVSTSVAARRLGEAAARFDGEVDGLPPSLTAPARLLRMGGELAPDGAEAANGDLHHLHLPGHAAIAETLRGFARREGLDADEVRARVRERFPALAPLPPRPALDDEVARADVGWRWSESARRYELPDYVPATTGLSLSQTATPRGAVARVKDATTARLEESIARRSFVALGMSAGSYEATVEAVARTFAADVVDVTGLLIAAMQEFATQHGINWDVVVASDAKPETDPNRANLNALVGQCVPQVVESIAARVDAGDDTVPVVLTEAAPLARYGHLGVLTRWTDMTSPRHRAVWLAVPHRPNTPPQQLDGVPLPLDAPGQYVRVDPQWQHAESDETNEVETAR